MLYYGTVIKIEGNHLHVKLPSVGGDYRIGPLPSVILQIVGPENIVLETSYNVGDKVVVGQVAHMKDEFVVLGRIG